MRKRIWSILLVLCLIVSLLPAEVLAASVKDGETVETPAAVQPEFRLEKPKEPTHEDILQSVRQRAAALADDDGEEGDEPDYTSSLVNGVLTISGTGTIEEYAFQGNTAIRQLVIEEGIEGIGGEAFAGCTRLRSVSLPESLTYLGWSAFRNCTNLTSITIPAGLTEVDAGEEGPFYGCEVLSTAAFAEGTDTIPAYIFAGCSGLETVTIPEGVTAIREAAFFNCPRLDNVVLPTTLCELGANAFSNCVRLSSITIPADLDTVEYDGWDYGPFAGCDALITASFAEGATVVPQRIFASCTALETVTIPEGVIRIEEYAFHGCTHLQSIAFPGSLRKIGTLAFENCVRLKEVTLPANLDTVERDGTECGPFANCDLLKTAVFSTGTRQLPDGIFAYCTALESVTIPQGVTRIGESAFYNCINLKSVSLPSSLRKLGTVAFGNCASLNSVVIPENLDTVERDGTEEGPFSGCDSLKTASFEDGLQTVPAGLFAFCRGLETVTIPEGVLTIGDSAFRDCTRLREVNLPSTLKKLETFAFGDCKNLTTIEIPGSLETVESEWTEDGPFGDCKNLTSVSFASGIRTIPDSIFAGSYLESVVIPSGVTAIGDYAFRASRLKSVELPSTLQKLGEHAFADCPNLTYIKIPKALDTVEYAPFASCRTLREVAFESGATAIPDGLFEECSGLESLVIPSGIRTIGENAFASCHHLAYVDISNNVRDIGNYAFGDCENLVIYCPLASEAIIYAIENSIPFMPNGTFVDNDSFALDRTKTNLDLDLNAASANGFFRMTISYGIKNAWRTRLTDNRVRIKLPENVDLDESSLLLNDEGCENYSYYDWENMLEIPVDQSSGTIKLSLRIREQGEMYGNAVLVSNYDGQEHKEVIGVLHEQSGILTINAPDVVGTSIVDVSGLAPVSSQVKLYVDGREAASVKASKTGVWSAQVDLGSVKDYQEYTIEVRAEKDGETQTKSAKVLYHYGEVKVTAFYMYYNEHDEDNRVDLLQTDGKLPFVYFMPNSQFDFEIRFDHPEQIDTVYVTSTRNNVKKYLEAHYDATLKAFVTDGYFDPSDTSYVPGTISLEYTKVQDDAFLGENKDLSDYSKKASQITEDSYTELESTDHFRSVRFYINALISGFDDQQVDITVSTYDPATDGDIVTWQGFDANAGNIISYQIEGVDGQKYTVLLDLSDPYRYVMVIRNAAGTEALKIVFSTVILDEEGESTQDLTLKDIFDAIYTPDNEATRIIRSYQLETDLNKLRDEVLTTSSAANRSYAIKQIEILEQCQIMFTLVVAFMPAIFLIAPTIYVFSTLTVTVPFLVFTGFVAIFTGIAIYFWSIRTMHVRFGWFILRFVVDPSGYVYNAITNEPLEDVEATAYWIEYDGSEAFWDNIPSDRAHGTLWDASEYGQDNPLYTGPEGQYAWDVPEGWWRVKFEKDGYETVWSDWMTVPPVQTEVNIGMYPETTIEITSQPQDFTGASGEVATFTVEATGEGLTYQWQYQNPGSSVWKNSASTSNTVNCTLTAARSGRLYRCIITDVNGSSVITRSALLTVVTPLKITQQPQDFTGKTGDTATFTVKATGDGLTYQWQYQNPGSSTWKNSASTTDTATCVIAAARDGRAYRCIVTDAHGSSVTSSEAKIVVLTGPVITQQPQDFTGASGEVATFTVKATGSGLTYQWQYQNPGSSVWKNSASTTDTVTCTLTAARSGRLYRCIITDASGSSVTSASAKITVVTPLKITAQPQDFTGKSGDTATFTVKATGEGLTYQWQYRNPGSSTWKNSASTTNSATCVITAARDGRAYRCIITDANGNSVTSSEAKIIVLTGPVITSQPQDFTGRSGDTAKFTVKATGEGLTYQWQFKDVGGSWRNSASTTASATCVINAARNGRLYRCIITDASGNSVTSAEAKIIVLSGPVITQQPQDFTGKSGDTATFTVKATGEGLTYQWQYQNPGSTVWKDSSSTTNTATCTLTTARSGRLYRCIITDASGVSVTTNAAKIIVTA